MKRMLSTAWIVWLCLFCRTAPAALLGIGTQIGQPTISLTNPSTTVWNKTAGTLTVTADPYQFRMDALSGFQSTGTPRSLVFKLRVDPVSGTLAGGVTGDDFVLEGQLDGTYNGVLLKGEIEAFGFLNLSGTTDFLDFRFRVTGGALASHPNFLGKDIGVTMTVESSTMSGSNPFAATSFAGNAKGSLGPIASLTPCSASLGDVVWSDDNGNGKQDPGEQGINNVTVKLLQGGNVLQTVNTGPGPLGQQGYYAFTNLCAGTYSVEAVAPTGYSPSPINAPGTTPTDDSNPNPSPVTLSVNNASDTTLDFGFVPATAPVACEGEIGDYVWEDLDRDGLQEAGESGIGGVSVTLLKTIDGVDEEIETVTTDTHGAYRFTMLCAGAYLVRVETATLPAGLTASASNQGGNNTLDSNPTPFRVHLGTDTSQDVTVDFGYHRPCSARIGDYVWHDTDRDGLQDTDELGIDGVRVYLFDEHNTLIETVTTGQNPVGGAKGYYQFAQRCQGSYRVDVEEADLPAGFVPSPGGQGADRSQDSNVDNADPNAPVLVELAGDFTDDQTIDFGYNAPCTGSIGNFVWHDQNRNGVQDANEPGLDGVTLNLKNSQGAVIATTTTGPHPSLEGAHGFYRFEGFCAGAYKVEVDTTTVPDSFTATPANVGSADTDSNPNPALVTLAGDFAHDDTLDFGFVSPCTGELGDFIWEDLNRNGIQESGEPGINGVLVILKAPDGTEITRTFTGDSADGRPGYYRFTGLCPGAYRIDAATPEGLLPSASAAPGSTPANDSNVVPTDVNLGEGEVNDTIDFGFHKPCSGVIGNFVWKDLDLDGLQDAGEPGIPGATVKLLGVSGGEMASTVTGEAGDYEFGELCPGTYQVVVVTPSGTVAVTPNAEGSTSENDSNGVASADGQESRAAPTVLAEAQIDHGIDFGFHGTARLGNFVWHDQDRDGAQDDGEPGLDDVRVLLKDASGNLLRETRTAANPDTLQPGWYLFDGLNGGVPYTVEVDAATLPAGFTPTVPAAGDAATDSNGSPTTATLASDTAEDLTLDFGYVSPCTGALGDRVWHDLNLNGVQDAGEPGLDGVVVTLLDETGTVVIQTTNTETPVGTNDSGFYRFTGLCPGTYQVVVATPDGFTPTPTGAGDQATDSNGLPNGPASVAAAVLLPSDNWVDPTIDFGFVSPCQGTMGDFVWLDANLNGLQDAGETGVNGVTVNLLDANGGLLTSATTANHPATGQPGYYQFAGQCPGTYQVAVVAPAGHGLTLTEQGADRAADSNPNPTTVVLDTVYSSVQTLDFGLVQSNPGGGGSGEVPYCPPGDTSGNNPIGVLYWHIEANGDVKVRFEQSRNVNDNSYGTGSIGWHQRQGQHWFKDLYNSDQAQFVFKDAAGHTVLDFYLDYLSAQSGTPSGYASLGPVGGDGRMIAGNVGHILSWTTSQAENINSTGYCANGNCTVADINLLVDSPAADANYTLANPAAFGRWDFTNAYEMTISKDAFGGSGFGGVAVGEIHNSPQKSGTAPFNPVPCAGSGTGGNASLGDRVWIDDGDGVQQGGEAGAAYVTVELYACSAGTPAGAPVQTTSTSTNGDYSFTQLAAGSYAVKFGLPTNYQFTVPGAGGNGALDSDVNPLTAYTACLTLAAGETNPTVDAGLKELAPPPPPPATASLGDFVWNDADRDGQQDADEPGIPNATVSLYACGATTPTQTTATGNDGHYLFSNLQAGCYEVAFSTPSGYARTTANTGADATDSDMDAATGRTGAYTLAAGQTETGVDAGFYSTSGTGGVSPHTIGFWKTHASCAGASGNQDAVLDQTLAQAEPAGIKIGLLALHGSTANPDAAPDCAKAVNLLDKSTIDKGKKKASDPAFNLAAQFLAARLNFQAGAVKCSSVADADSQAQALLEAVRFNGVSSDKMSQAQTTLANSLATTLDNYNNNQVCN
jgi:hypothetical protein